MDIIGAYVGIELYSHISGFRAYEYIGMECIVTTVVNGS